MAFAIHLAPKLSQCQTRFFLSFMFVPYDQFFLGQIPVLCTAQMNKNSKDPQRSAFNFSKTSLIRTILIIKQNGCLLNARTKRDWSRGSQFPAVFAACRACHSVWQITTKIELTHTKWVKREKIPLRLEDLSENNFSTFWLRWLTTVF